LFYSQNPSDQEDRGVAGGLSVESSFWRMRRPEVEPVARRDAAAVVRDFVLVDADSPRCLLTAFGTLVEVGEDGDAFFS
jgi:hypothetical protein